MTRNILITGANKGLGLALTGIFLHSEDRVFAGIHHESLEITRLKGQFADRLVSFPMDVDSEDSVRKAAKAVSTYTDSLDILINNAGILIRESADTTIENLDIGGIKRTFEVNSIGPLIVLKYFIGMLEKGKRKVIVNISSEAGSISNCQREAWYDYCMSKAALNMASKILQNYTKKKKMKVLVIQPGWMRTQMGGRDADISPDESAEGILKLIEQEWDVDDHIFFDYSGKKWDW